MASTSGRGDVIHYSGLSDGLSAGRITIASIKQFHGGTGYAYIRVWEDRKITPEKTVERAHARLGEHEYNLPRTIASTSLLDVSLARVAALDDTVAKLAQAKPASD
ncbi:MAG: hypothetical protein EOO22_01265 [Comamonadaceae bacterium]|nr:MAG: hypothetical protein EOO22_01265 [Comamonadaceae bacterium]